MGTELKPLSDDDSQKKTSRFTLVTTGVGIFWFALGFIFYALKFHSAAISDEGKDWGDFGVFIAGFSGTGVAAITLVAVAYGIRVQAEDLAKSRAFMAAQSASMKRQTETTEQQAFDSVFFNLLDSFSSVRDSVSVTIFKEKREPGKDIPGMKEVSVKGRRAFEEFYQYLFQAQIGSQKAVPNRLQVLQQLFMGQYRLSESELGPYFRTLYQIFKWIDRSSITEEQKIDYAKMARAQLSDLELSVLFYDGLTDMAIKMKPLIEKYAILKHVNAKNLLLEDDKSNPLLYDLKAFG